MKPELKNWPLYIVLFTVFLIPFYFFRFSFYGIKTNIFEIFVLISLWATFVPTFKNKISVFEKDEIKKFSLPLAFLLISFISIFFSGDYAQALGIFKGWFFVPILFAWILTKHFNQHNIKLVSLPIYASLMIVSLWAILQKLGIIGLTFYQVGDSSFFQYLYEGHRYFGPFESPNFLAMFLVPFSIMTLPVGLFLHKKLQKNIFLLTFLIPLISLYLTHSRAGFISAAISILIYLNYSFINKEKAAHRRPFFHWFFVGLLVSLNFFYIYGATRMIQPTSGSDEIRVKIYDYTLKIIGHSPLAGAGLGGFYDRVSALSINDLSFIRFGLPYALHPHNLLLAMWVNLGIIGLILFIILATIIFKNAFKTDSPIRAVILASMAAVLIHGLFDTTYFKNDLSVIFWLIYAVSIIFGKDKSDVKKS